MPVIHNSSKMIEIGSNLMHVVGELALTYLLYSYFIPKKDKFEISGKVKGESLTFKFELDKSSTPLMSTSLNLFTEVLKLKLKTLDKSKKEDEEDEDSKEN